MKQGKLSGNGDDRDHGIHPAGGAAGPRIDHGWGDFRTWLIIVGLSVAVIVTTLIMYSIIGKHTLQNWNLGNPPTSTSFISGQ
ncbi:MAG TPA: hypothetical protein VGM51_03110 [Armatimonadota bacterium]